MKTRLLAALLIFGAFGIAGLADARSSQAESTIDSFWTKFKAAVIKNDKETVASLSQFPIAMPYGHRTVKSKIELLKRFREVFNGEADAAKCFAQSKPLVEPNNKNRFTVGCKNAAGDEVIIYRFVRTRTLWKFKGLDNINE